MSPTAAAPWTEAEPAAPLLGVLRHLVRRALRRPGLLAAITVAATACLLGPALLTPRRYQCTVVISITEGDLDPGHAPQLYRELRTHVTEVLLSQRRLLAVIVAHHLYGRQLARSPERAVEALREDLVVSVWRNYFLEARDPDSPAPRSARFSLSWSADTPELAAAVVSDLARTAMEAEHADRFATAEAAARSLDAPLALGRARLDGRRAARARAHAIHDSDEGAAWRLALAGEQAADDGLALGLDAVEAAAAQRAQTARQEERRLGPRFAFVEGGAPVTALGAPAAPAAPPIDLLGATRTGPTTRALLLGAPLLFALLLPLAAVLLGALDHRVHFADDVAAQGLSVLGHLPSTTPASWSTAGAPCR